MAGMHGADVEQLRALARSFDDAASRLDNDRMSVGNAIRINAWVGPVAVRFRAEWDSAHSAKLAHAASRLHTAAAGLRRNADEQERTSMSNGANPSGRSPWDGARIPYALIEPPRWSPFSQLGSAMAGLGGAVASMGGTFGGVLGSFVGGTAGMLKGIVGAVELPAGIAEMGHTAAHVLLNGKGAQAWTTFGQMAEATKIGRFLGAAGSTLGVISTGFGAYETVTKALEGDTEGAVYSGIKTLIGAAAVIPSPVQPLAAAVSIGIGVGEILAQNPAVTRAVTDTVVRVGDAIGHGAVETARSVGAVVEGAGKAAGSFLDGVGKAAKKLWPW